MTSHFQSITVAFCLIQLLAVGCSAPATKNRETASAASTDAKTSDSTSVQESENTEMNQYAAADFALSEALDDPAVPAVAPPTQVPPDSGSPETLPCPQLSKALIEKSSNRILSRLDADKSGAVSAEEFSQPKFKQIPEAVKEKFKAHRMAIFSKFAGDDKSLSQGEIQLLVADRFQRVCAHRSQDDNGTHAEKFKEYFAQLFKGIDADGDGKISLEEWHKFQNVQAPSLETRLGEKPAGGQGSVPKKNEGH